MVSKGICLECGGPRDRGPYTKLCSACFVKPCRRCGEPNLRGPGTVLCSVCKDLPPKDGRTICKRCGQPNDRGGRTYICSTCVAADSSHSRKINSKIRALESPKGKSWCGVCEKYKNLEEFYAKKEYICRSCRAIHDRKSGLVRQYNITEDQYNQIFTAQGNVCAICGNKPNKQRFHVDHDHKTGLIRGILCLWCNHKVLGGAKEKIEILRSAVLYLENPPAVAVVGEIIANNKANRGKQKTNLI